LPETASVIDPTAIRLQSGVDNHLQEIIRTHLDPKDRVELSRQYRTLREEFSDKDAVREINERLQTDDDDLTDRKLSLAIDISQRYTWESSLIAHLDDLPLHLIGKGDQNALKTLLAIGRKADNAKIVLIEEPETHLSHASLRKLLYRVEDRCIGKQLVIATHSNYVLNKLGLNNLILLGNGMATRIIDLPPDTVDYFKKLAGFDTLRLVLAEGAILVEGPSDELVIQRGYKDAKGRLPIDDGIDVISVGLAHKRFLDLAIRLNRRAWVVTDNDHKTLEKVKERFSGYLDSGIVTLHVGSDPVLNTLEPQIVAANNLETLNAALGTKFSSKEEVQESMLRDKTGSALSIFESKTKIEMPEYIKNVFTK
jgi:putative ATP-dependent endonuclease of the OLD family